MIEWWWVDKARGELAIVFNFEQTPHVFRDYPFNKYAKFSKKLTFLTPCAYQAVRNGTKYSKE